MAWADISKAPEMRGEKNHAAPGRPGLLHAGLAFYANRHGAPSHSRGSSATMHAWRGQRRRTCANE